MVKGLNKKETAGFELTNTYWDGNDKSDFEETIFEILPRNLVRRSSEDRIVQKVSKDIENIVNTVREPLVILDSDFKVISASHNFYQMFGIDPKINNGRGLFDLENQMWDIPKLRKLLEQILPKKEFINNFKLELDLPNLERQILLINSRWILDEQEKKEGIIMALENITERVKAEEEIRKKFLKFTLDEGKLYIVKESTLTKSIEAFNELLKVGFNGLAISRIPEKSLKKQILNYPFDFFWLAEKDETKCNAPVLNEIEQRIENLPRNSVVIIDRIDYLIFKHGFKSTLSFVQHLREFAHLFDKIIILSLDPSTLSDYELALLEKEGEQIELKQNRKKVPSELLTVLKFIYSENVLGNMPSYSNIAKELQISRPTVRKRIRLLNSFGYVKGMVKGKRKIVELTELGNNILLN